MSRKNNNGHKIGPQYFSKTHIKFFSRKNFLRELRVMFHNRQKNARISSCQEFSTGARF